ncbi:hypothetical protein JCM10908_005778 [Rhodotorula pacifica]|uniref:uncharacterized protein n=1 Tax=Rhodotorula pacifica TaxID=1495444 RepID=UPI003175EE73
MAGREAADPLALQRRGSDGAGLTTMQELPSASTTEQAGQAGLADRLQSLQLADEPDRTQPHPVPVASTSSLSPPPPQPAHLVEPDHPTFTEPTDAQPQKRKVVLLKRPATPTRRSEAIEARDGRSDEARADAIDHREGEDYSRERAREPTADTTTTSPHGPASPGDLAGTEPAALDPVLHGALNHPRDRFLLLRAEVELERFILNQTMTRLPLAPPHFQPGLNSYQRLLIHRLADMFGITREVEPAPPTMWNAGMINPATGQPQGVVVLVKSEIASIPAKKLASHVPAPDPTPSVASPVPHLSVARTSSALSSPAASPDNSSPAASVSAAVAATAAAPPPQPVFKILPRASRGTSSASSSADIDDDGSSSFSTSTRSKLRRDLTLEEREAAYKEARERIFNQPDPVERSSTTAPSTSAASSNAGEDAASVQSLGYGITRPSSAGSTFSRSSAALSVSGQRPPPSIASDSNSSMRSGYFGYYQQQQPPVAPPPPPAGSGGIPYPMPNLRSAVPTFDPATGGWTYHPSSEYAQTPSYSSMMPYGMQQPPPPPPPPMPYHPAQTAQFDASGSAVTPSAWHRSLPSPALSGSSGSSYPPSQHMPPPAPSASSPHNATSSDAGYLMRFPEGAIVTAGGGVVGPPQPYAAVAVGGGAGLRSSSTLSLGASSSASRVATRGGTSSGPNSLRRLSQSTTQSLGSMHSSSAPLSDDAASRRSPSATSGAADDSPEASLAGENEQLSEVGSSVGGGSAPSSLAGAGGGAGGSSDGGRRHGRKATIVSRSGRSVRLGDARDEVNDRDDADSSREPSPLHPSLPAKPTWASAAAAGSPGVQSGSKSPASPSTQNGTGAAVPSGPGSLHSLSSSSSTPAFPPLSGVIGGESVAPPPPPPNQGPWTRPSGPYGAAPAGPYSHAMGTASVVHANGYSQFAIPPQAPIPHPHPQPHPQQQQQPQYPQHPQQHQHTQPSSYAAWLSQAAVGPPPAHVGYPHIPRFPTQQPESMYVSTGPAPPQADLMTMPDMRRPPPRSTQLFDPNKPASSGGMRRVASGAGSARR